MVRILLHDSVRQLPGGSKLSRPRGDAGGMPPLSQNKLYSSAVVDTSAASGRALPLSGGADAKADGCVCYSERGITPGSGRALPPPLTTAAYKLSNFPTRRNIRGTARRRNRRLDKRLRSAPPPRAFGGTLLASLPSALHVGLSPAGSGKNETMSQLPSPEFGHLRQNARGKTS